MKSNSLSDNIEPDKLIAMFLEGTSFPGPQAELLQTDPVYRVIHEMLEKEMQPVYDDLAIIKYWDPAFAGDGLEQILHRFRSLMTDKTDRLLKRTETFLRRIRAYGKQGMPGRRGQKSPGAILPRVEVLGALLDNWDEWDIDLLQNSLCTEEGLPLDRPKVIVGLESPLDFLGGRLGFPLGLLQIGEHAALPSAVEIEGDRVAGLAMHLVRVDGNRCGLVANDTERLALGVRRGAVLRSICQKFVGHCLGWRVNCSPGDPVTR